MSTTSEPLDFQVNIMMHAAGPIRPRTKHKEHKLLRAEGSVRLPFAPYPGLYLSYSNPRKRGEPLTLYLRVRAVEWNIAESRFECVADEMAGSSLFSETYEVRGGARIEKHFEELQDALRQFGFHVTTDAAVSIVALDKHEEGTLKE